MDVLALSRLQFGLTIAFHFLFVPFTLGFSLLVAAIETQYVRFGDIKYKAMAKFWGRLLAINFLLGVVTGLTMEFQFGTNWSEYSKFTGDVFGAPLAFEVLSAFFLESTFLSVWVFGWDRLSQRAHLFAAWMVPAGAYISVFWIVTANGFMQHPVGYMLRNNHAELINFWTLLTNSYSWYLIIHVIFASLVLSGFIMMGISAYHLFKKQGLEVFESSFRIGLLLSVIASFGVVVSGHQSGQNMARAQPAKFAAAEAIWRTQRHAPFYLIQIPDVKNESYKVRLLPITGLDSFLAYNNVGAEIAGLKSFPRDNRPPVLPVFWSFRLMVLLGFYFLGLMLYASYLHYRNKLLNSTGFLRLVQYSIPLTSIAIILGWVVTEMGRQPWTVYNVFRTAHSVSTVPRGNVIFSLSALVAFYSILAVLDIYLIVKNAKEVPRLE
jgi:cytochrome d ubiquinol oxidase subunit I